jgi:hypothetical protein
VLSFADRLRADGIDAEIDQYNAAPPEGWPLWCEQQIEAADFVLMICTETYYRRVSGDEERGKGLGVVWEARIIRQLLYDAGAVRSKFVPALFSDASPEQIPTPIKGWTRYVVDTSDGYEELYRRLTGQPRLLRPTLGKIRALPARPRQWPEARLEVAAPAPSSTSRLSQGRGTVTADSDHSVHISENMTDGVMRVLVKHSTGSKANRIEQFSVESSEDIWLGRDPAATVTYDPEKDNSVSRRHAVIRTKKDGELSFTIEDLQSRNGTFVNGERLTGERELLPGNVIELGAGGPKFTFDIEPRPPHLMARTNAVTDDHNETEVHDRKVTLPSADRIDILSELAAMKALLVGLNTGARTKIANALAEAIEEAVKPQPDKNEIGGALERALGYAGKATDFRDKAGKIGTHVQNAVAWLDGHWHKLLPLVEYRDRTIVNLSTNEGRNLKIGIVVGLLFVLVVVLLQELRILRQNPDWAIDTIMPYLAGIVQHPTQVKPFVFIAVDEESYRAWNEPWFTPRDKIAQIMEKIADEHNPPLAIVVDIDLSRASGEAFLSEYETPDSIGNVGPSSHSATGDEGIACESLTNGNDKRLCQAIIDASGKQIPVVLARDFKIGFRDPHSVGPLRLRGSFLDPILGTAQKSSSSGAGATAPPWVSTRSPRVFWGSPLFDRDSDLTIRRWRLWERACVNNVIAAVPSVQLLIAALVQPGHVEDAVKALEQSLRLSKQTPCSEEPDLITPQLQLENLRVDLADKDLGHRIVFALGTQNAVSPMVPLASSAEDSRRKTREEEVRLLEVISANRLTNMQKESFDPALFRDRIVVIGASYQDSSDIHATPAGSMAGALIIINSMHTLLDYGQLRPAPWPIRILIGGIVVAVIALLFHVFNPQPAGIMSAAMLFVAFVIVNAITLPDSMLTDVSLAGALFTFYIWFVSGFFNDGSFSVFRKGWGTTIPGWQPWRWRMKKNDSGGTTREEGTARKAV